MSTIPKWAAVLLEDEGKDWIESFEFTEEEWDIVTNSYNRGHIYISGESLKWNCGAREICAKHCTSIPVTVGLLLYAGSISPASLVVATINEYQGYLLCILVSVGFTSPTEWVRNPNSGNNICLLTYNLSPSLFVQPKEDEEDEEDWGRPEAEEEEDDYDYS